VHRLSVNELIDLWSTREALETLVAGDVAGRITPEQVGQLRTLFERFATATVDSCSDEYAVADAQFHATLLGLCRNQLALRINEHFLILERATIVGLLRPPSITLPEHLAIIDALQQHDRRQAMQRMGEHVENTRLTVEASIARIRQLGMDIDQVTVNGLPRLRSGEESKDRP
jgi:DNA-binding GntR family transcriptional regulator